MDEEDEKGKGIKFGEIEALGTWIADDNDEEDKALAETLLGLSLSNSGPDQQQSDARPRIEMSTLPGTYPQTPIASRVEEAASVKDGVPARLENGHPQQQQQRDALTTPATEDKHTDVDLDLSKLSIKPASSKTQMIYQLDCFKHKFSRNVKPSYLALIVERPERSRAAILGAAAAKTRLGLSALQTFDMDGISRREPVISPYVEDAHGSEWMVELSDLCERAAQRLAEGELEVPPPYHSGDLYFAPESRDALEGCLGACYEGVDRLLTDACDRVHVSIRPPGHHCSSSVPSGFCLLNNVHCAISYAHRKYGVTRVAILDFDLHVSVWLILSVILMMIAW